MKWVHEPSLAVFKDTQKSSSFCEQSKPVFSYWYLDYLLATETHFKINFPYIHHQNTFLKWTTQQHKIYDSNFLLFARESNLIYVYSSVELISVSFPLCHDRAQNQQYLISQYLLENFHRLKSSYFIIINRCLRPKQELNKPKQQYI